MKKSSILVMICLLLAFAGNSQSAKGDGPYNQLIIRGVMLINGNGAPPLGPIDIVVRNNTIEDIKVVGFPGVPIEKSNRPKLESDGKELDCSGMYLMPGFVDMHGHIGGTHQGAEPEYVFRLWMGFWHIPVSDKGATNPLQPRKWLKNG